LVLFVYFWIIKKSIVLKYLTPLLMPQNKRVIFPGEDQGIAAFALSLSHPARLSILVLLKEREFMLCHEIAENLPLSRPTISQHLAMLLHHGLVRRVVEGGEVGYALHPHGMKAARLQLQNYLRKVA
jgi:DNA-binding transcriptional ArsR family regulator